MYPLFETIRIDNGIIKNRKWHEERMVQSRKELWNLIQRVDLDEIIRIPESFRKGIIRCKILYGKEPGPVTFEKYVRQPVRTLKLLECNHIDYHLKYADRLELNELLSEKEDCDEIIIVKDGLITETSISNLVFFDGNQWYTPDKPLLKGTCRQRLLEEKKIRETEIRVEALYKFKGFELINAMRDLEEEEMIPIENIKL